MSSLSGILFNRRFELSQASFLPGGEWTPRKEYGRWSGDPNAPLWTLDSLSGDFYLNQPTNLLRFKLSVLTGCLAGLLGNTISLTVNAAYRCLKVVSLAHFWRPLACISWMEEDQVNGLYHAQVRWVELAKDIARIVATPFAWIALLCVSWGGALSPRENGPRDAAKIFSSIEIAMYGGLVDEGCFGWAPCYQPKDFGL